MSKKSLYARPSHITVCLEDLNYRMQGIDTLPARSLIQRNLLKQPMDDSENEVLLQQMALQVFLRRWNRTGNGDDGDSLMRREVPLSSPPLIVSQTMSTHSSSIRDVRSWERDPNTFKNEGCKRCLCKNSKCLMLYCACFVSGEYCAEGERLQNMQQSLSQNSGVRSFDKVMQQSLLRIVGDWPPFPQIFIRGKFVGGSDAILDVCQWRTEGKAEGHRHQPGKGRILLYQIESGIRIYGRLNV
ncbi:hypothetical protein MRB53_005056 [Persea americana]|uniref:Uncharacterized protein n=1 Tax=Persea americana TaxID=3435 RepID=A0ACC2MCZ0_PERAE|nr:hypothetical protein MRB53_005056 [Persea americana]